MARSTLNELIEIVRGYAEAGSADFPIGTVNYWDADQVQRVLDRHRLDVYQEPIQMIPRHTGGGSIAYYEHQSSYDNFEQTDGGSAIFWLEDAAGDNASTAIYSVDYQRGRVTFTQDTAGTAYYLTGRSYDLYGAAAEMWNMKASHQSGGGAGFDWSTDNMSVKRSQVKQQYVEMAHYYEGMARPRVIQVDRSDIDPVALK